MDVDHEPVADRRRGSKWGVRKKTSRLGWLCNPQVLKAVIALARLGFELVPLHSGFDRLAPEAARSGKLL